MEHSSRHGPKKSSPQKNQPQFSQMTIGQYWLGKSVTKQALKLTIKEKKIPKFCYGTLRCIILYNRYFTD